MNRQLLKIITFRNIHLKWMHDIFSQAYKQGLFGNKYVWIIVGWYLEDWWTKTDEECTGENLLKAASNLILTSPLRLSNSPQPTISNKVRNVYVSSQVQSCPKQCTAVLYQKQKDLDTRIWNVLNPTLNICYSNKKGFAMKEQPWQRCKLTVMTNYHFYHEWNNVSLSSISSSIQEIRADNWANTNNSFFISYFQTAQQLNSTYEERCRHSNFTSHEYASFTYDAVWTIALMLNKSIPLLGEKNKTLETIKYGDKETAEIMKDILFRTNFTGMSVG